MIAAFVAAFVAAFAAGARAAAVAAEAPSLSPSAFFPRPRVQRRRPHVRPRGPLWVGVPVVGALVEDLQANPKARERIECMSLTRQ